METSIIFKFIFYWKQNEAKFYKVEKESQNIQFFC